ncbi:MAG: hypothetical protein LC722_09095 [Actinobacteria bacterium]|nr:hypothetical protein [Actinomycetota bacterium]
MRICFAVRIEGVDHLVRARPRPLEEGIEINGVSARRARPLRDRVWASLSNRPGVPGGAVVDVRPPVAGQAEGLESAICLAILAAHNAIPLVDIRRHLSEQRQQSQSGA